MSLLGLESELDDVARDRDSQPELLAHYPVSVKPVIMDGLMVDLEVYHKLRCNNEPQNGF